jgi:replicative DNA helicase
MTPAEIEGRVAAMPGLLAQAVWDPAETWDAITARWGTAGLRTGWQTLDGLTGGLWPGELIVAGGRTSHGKTAFMCATALRMAAEGIAVDIVTLEDPIEAITRRLVAQLTGIPYRRLRVGEVTPEERARAGQAIVRLTQLPLHVTGIDRHGQATEDGVLGLLSQATGRVVILDHLQRVLTKDQSRAYALERVLGRIHGLAQRTGQVAWVNCQLNREVEARKDGRPTLADLRDTGAIEILARQVWLLSWPRKWDPKRDYRDFLVDVAKASESGTGPVDFRWDPGTGRFWTPDEGAPWDTDKD